MIRALSFCRAKRQYRYRPVFALVDVQPTGLYDSDSIPFKPNESTPKGVLSFGGLEGDRTLEPHGCEPCALPAELQAHISLYQPEKRGRLSLSLMYYTTDFSFVKKKIDYLFKLSYNKPVTFDKAVLVGEPAVPCNLQSATAGMNSRSRKFSVSSDPGKQ